MLQCEGGEGGVTWMKDEGVLPDSAVVFGGTLWIFGVALSDEGEYSCLGAHGAANYLLQVHGEQLLYLFYHLTPVGAGLNGLHN